VSDDDSEALVALPLLSHRRIESMTCTTLSRRSFPQFFKSIGKDDIFLMPYVGWMAYVYGILPIDRKHRDTAFKQLARATRNCQRGVPVALRSATTPHHTTPQHTTPPTDAHPPLDCSPEGTRSKTGQLMRFKKGPFYVQAVRACLFVHSRKAHTSRGVPCCGLGPARWLVD
jgi:hypothetical protein